jgi:hypothetical protein
LDRHLYKQPSGPAIFGNTDSFILGLQTDRKPMTAMLRKPGWMGEIVLDLAYFWLYTNCEREG